MVLHVNQCVDIVPPKKFIDYFFFFFLHKDALKNTMLF